MENLNMFVGKVIESVVLGVDDALHFVFQDGSKMKLWHDAGMCCERRYMTLDDDLSFCAGSTLVGIKVRDASSLEDSDGVHEIQFVEVMTNRGCFSVVTHNEHNGYYSGFCIRIDYE